MRQRPILPSALHQRFWDVQQVSPDQALLDKCDVVIGGWSFEAKRYQVATIVPRLSQMEVSAGKGESARLFEKRSADDNRYSHTLTVLGTGSGESVQYPHPTFSGALKLREIGHEGEDRYAQRPWEGIFFAYLNLNRSLQSQALTRRDSGSSGHWTYSRPYNLAMAASESSKIKERLLAPSDNILDRSRKRTEYVQSKPAEEHFRDYVLAIFNTVYDALNTRPIKVATQPQPTITLQTVEVCWDFFDWQPVLSVRMIRNSVESIAQKMRVRYLPEFRMEEGLDYNSPSVMLQVVDGIAIRFYAKTETTIRFEVVYSQAAINSVANEFGIHPLEEAVRIVAAVKEDGAMRLNNLLSCIHEALHEHEDHATTDELIEAVIGEADNTRAAMSLLTQLAFQHRVAPFPKDPIYPTLRSLKKAGVLMNEARSARSRTYVITPRYRRARAKLASSYLVDRKIRRNP